MGISWNISREEMYIVSQKYDMERERYDMGLSQHRGCPKMTMAKNREILL
jgi:hypothetical protein